MDHPLNSAIGAAGARYGAIAAGLLIGVAARYGLTLNEGQRVSWRSLVADALLLGMLGLIAIAFADWLNLTGNARVLAGALAGASGDRLVRLARDRFLQRVDSETETLAGAAKAAELAEVPAGAGLPDAMAVQSPTGDSDRARVGNALQAAHRTALRTRPPVDQIELLRRLDASE